MAARQKWYIDIASRRLCSDAKGTPLVLPTFSQEDKFVLLLVFMEPNPNGTPYVDPYSIVSTSGLAVALKIGTIGGTILVSQTGWVSDTAQQVLSALIDFNTANMIAAFAAVTTISRTLEIEVSDSDGGKFTAFRASITIEAELITSGSPTATPGVTYYTSAEIDALFAKKVMSAGETITFTAPTDGRQRILGVNDGGTAKDDIV